MVKEENTKLDFASTFSFKIIYIFRINDEFHKGYLKIGDAKLRSNEKDPLCFPNNCHDLREDCKVRIDQYTSTAGIKYDLLYAEIAVFKECKPGKHFGEIRAFRDYNVHAVLDRSHIKKKHFDTERKQNEWYEVDLETAKKAILAVKNSQLSLNPSDISVDQSPIIFRPEQEEAIKKTISRFKKNNRMLWNAKMRFGKTLSALEVVKQEKFKKTIIITHRPVVNEGWFEDFNKIFYDTDEYIYGDAKKTPFDYLINSGKSFVYFASMQDLRGSLSIGGIYDKNSLVFSTDWNLVVIDEAHEGTKTELGNKVLEQIIKADSSNNTKVLELSGTPFNLLTDFGKDDIFTWDYIMEQEAKENWNRNHFGDSNPYEELPKMNIFTYHLEESLAGFMDLEDKAFNFKEFFRTWTGDKQKDFKVIPFSAKIGDFVHEKDIVSFLNLICKNDDVTNYPFSSSEYQDFFRHTLWIVPGVKEAKALSALLKKHPVFGCFEIINVAGDGDEEVESDSALNLVRKAITNEPEETRTITLSCGRLTTGVTVPEWTAVLMLAGSYSTAASQYLQTIFRVQSPANINGRIKENCYVFDFAPDRTLKMIAESIQLSVATSASVSSYNQLGQFLNYCPVIAIDKTGMKEFKVDFLLQELKKAYTERVARNGFDDIKIYNQEMFKLDDLELKDFERLKGILKSSMPTKKAGEININQEGFSTEEFEEIKKLEKTPKSELSDEDKERLEKLKQDKKNRASAISILRAISIRIPLIVYGMNRDIDCEVSVEDFADPEFIDDLSWEEFMPKGLTREDFIKFSKYYDKSVFIGACRNIRARAKSADELEPTERVQRIAEIFATFKNPDKETVLTPWRVVNLHLSDTLGGYDFYNEDHSSLLDEPRFVDRGEVTRNVFNIDSNILEINSKSGLYALYMTYSIYRNKLKSYLSENTDTIATFKLKQMLWDSVVKNSIFVVCKTPMAKTITKRTLVGYRNCKANTRYFENLINQLQQSSKLKNFIRSMHQGKSYWKVKESDNLKFNAIVGNPPYQVITAKRESQTNGQLRSKSVFQYFQIAADNISTTYISLIYPGVRWIHRSGKGMQDFGYNQINDIHLQQLDFYPDSHDIFTDVSIADGLSIVFKNQNKVQPGFRYIYHRNHFAKEVYISNPGNNLISLNPQNEKIINSIIGFVKKNNLSFLNKRILPQKLFGIESSFIEEHPNVKKLSDVKEPINYDNQIKLFANDKAGKSGRTKWYVIDKNFIINNKKYIDEFQVVVSSANAGGQKRDNQIELIDNHSAFGRSRVALNSFTTKIEAENFLKYCKSYVIKFMFLMTDEQLTSLGKEVPDLMDYTNSNKFLDYSKEIDSQLYSLFGIDDEEQKYIEQLVNNIR